MELPEVIGTYFIRSIPLACCVVQDKLLTAAPWTEGDILSTVKFSVQVPWLEQMPVDSFTSVFHLSCHPGCVLDPSLLPVGKGKHHGLFRMRC